MMVRSGVAPNSHWRTVPHRSAMDRAETTAVPSMGIFLIIWWSGFMNIMIIVICYQENMDFLLQWPTADFLLQCYYF